MSKTIIVIGTARTGTSLTSGILHRLGVNMNPSVIEKTPTMQGGAYEDNEFINITIDISKTGRLLPENNQKLINLIRERNKQKLWGFKSALTHCSGNLIIPQLRNPHMIVTFKNPMDTAQSMIPHRKERYNQDHWTVEQMLTIHAQDLVKLSQFLQVHKSIPQFWVKYRDLNENPIETAQNISKWLGIEFTEKARQEIDSFVVKGFCSWNAKK